MRRRQSATAPLAPSCHGLFGKCPGVDRSFSRGGEYRIGDASNILAADDGLAADFQQVDTVFAGDFIEPRLPAVAPLGAGPPNAAKARKRGRHASGRRGVAMYSICAGDVGVVQHAAGSACLARRASAALRTGALILARAQRSMSPTS
ncbi:MAG: hypothetical protein B7Z29_20690 [Hyphomicrobium sp. 12-62-95]|nr:MAG: hypothetical protein B7Z29_20690 [Hyphomicrobium sp. 12-62-95]